jgi:hypothetical protein
MAFRLSGHHLDARQPAAGLSAVVGAVGLRDAQGSGLLALHARLDAVASDEVDGCLADGTLLEVISARGTHTLVPAQDAAVFTVGTLPADEKSLRARLKPFLAVLDGSGHTALEALELAKAVARDVLAGRPVDIGELSGSLTRALPQLSPMCRGRCEVAHIDQGLFDLVGECGVWRCERADGRLIYVAMPEPVDHAGARAELLRRYLRCYGPSTVVDFADWCGIGVSDARVRFEAAELAEVDRGWFLWPEDVGTFEAPPPPTGVRVVAPRDPFLLDRDRACLVPDRATQRRIWKSTPTDGVVLADGEIVATWRPKKEGTRLTLNVEQVAALSPANSADLDGEVAAIATLRGCKTYEVRVN